ncbi:hypothetical protein DLM45_15790 [Hyphomicrobium methylovorum]|uniref:NrsF family protein n=1 Tax=Hyphomicrobium methylovorum TaxID=84 RepID=UPI0015E750C1|nr:NrsF family protein [Hyphomicrobium methylovorum]MBA2127673.1 hypothetical protein [Hyphomicrobium methylovorum]
MRTDDLINALAADTKSVQQPIGRTVTLAVVAASLATLVLFLSLIGARPDFSTAASTSPRFLFKFVVTLSLAVPAFLLARAISRPDFTPNARLLWLALAPALLLAGTILEMTLVPKTEWHTRMEGHNSITCMVLIPMLALVPFAAIFYALKSGAPANSSMAGAIAGLLAGGIAATLYASHCTDDSPMFVAAWYPFGIVLMTILGTLLGKRFLRW